MIIGTVRPDSRQALEDADEWNPEFDEDNEE